jgi:hypothetical protein
MAWPLGIVCSAGSSVLLYPDGWRLVIVDLGWLRLLDGNWRWTRWLIQVGKWGGLVSVSNRRRLIVDLRRLGR